MGLDMLLTRWFFSSLWQPLNCLIIWIFSTLFPGAVELWAPQMAHTGSMSSCPHSWKMAELGYLINCVLTKLLMIIYLKLFFQNLWNPPTSKQLELGRWVFDKLLLHTSTVLIYNNYQTKSKSQTSYANAPTLKWLEVGSWNLDRVFVISIFWKWK